MRLLTLEEVAEILKLSIHTVRRWASPKVGKLKVVRIGNTVRVSETWLLSWIEGQTYPDRETG